MIVYFVALLLIFFALLYKYTSRKYDYWKNKNFEYIKPFPFFGSILPLFLLKKTVGEWLWEMYSSHSSNCFGIYVFDQPVLVIRSPKLVKSILVKDFQYFEDRAVVTCMDDPIMNNLMFFKKSPTWKPVRAKISPIFTSGKLKLMFPLILHESQQMADYIKTKAKVANVEAKDISAKYSTNVIAKCAFSIDAQSFQNENAEFRKISRAMFCFRFDTAMRQLGSWFMPNFIKFFKIQFFHSKLLNSLKIIFTEVLHSRVNSPDLNENYLMDLLIETNRKYGDSYFTDDAMVGHAIQFFAAGFETVSSTLSFTMYELAVHSDIQDRLRHEILECIEKENGLTYAAVQQMKYLDMVVCETLRKYPPVPFLDRVAKADYTIPDSDLAIEEGTSVYIPMFGLHYDPKYFPNPHQFDPERFVDKSAINSNEIYYIPFGDGPRVCIGERFGLMGVKVGLVSTLLNFKLEKSSNTPIPIKFEPKSIVLQSKVGVPITFVPL